MCLKNCKYELSTTEFLKFIADLKILPKLKKFDIGRVRKTSVMPILNELIKSGSRLTTISFVKFLPQNDEFFKLVKQLNVICKLYTNGNLCMDRFSSTEDVAIARSRGKQKYANVYTINAGKCPHELRKLK